MNYGIEDQALLLSYDSASPIPSRPRVVSRSQSSCVSPDEFTDGGGWKMGMGWRGAKS
jgi:hypothetical protein